MSWWSKKPAPEPVYSELGTEIYRLLEEQEGEWQCQDEGWRGGREIGLYHPKGHVFLCTGATHFLVYQGESANRSSSNRDNINQLLTVDDIEKLNVRVQGLMGEFRVRRLHETMKTALEKIKPNPFDRDAREMARQVLRGDVSAVRPLLDKLMEIVQETG